MSSYVRNNTVGAAVVAALGDFKSGRIRIFSQKSWHRLQSFIRARPDLIAAASLPAADLAPAGVPTAVSWAAVISAQRQKDFRKPLVFIHAYEAVDLRHFFRKLCVISLGKAAGDYQLSAAILVLRQLEYPVDGFFFRVVDEAAGVEYHHVGIFQVVRKLYAGLFHDALG